MTLSITRRNRGNAVGPFMRLFEDWFNTNEGGVPELWTEGRFMPALDVTEDESMLSLTAELPGVSKDDIDVSIEDGVLSLRGEKKEEAKSEGTGWHRLERRYGRFERRIRLPDYVDAENVDAEFKDGVLKLSVPKAERARPRTIKVK